MSGYPSIGVIGAGKWGRALYFALNSQQTAFITSRTYREIENFRSLEDVLTLDYLVIAISTQSVASWLEKNFIFKGQKILVASKGIDSKSGKFLNDIYSSFVPEENLGFLSGPSFASEVMESLPCALVINSKSQDLYDEFESFFPDFIKTYYSDDVMGAQIAGAYKNVLAIASGICEGLSLGNNAKASLLSRGLIEMQRFGDFFGATKESFLGLSGAGDLFLTANSIMSRNYCVGIGLAQKKSLQTILDEIGETAEGVKTSIAIHALSNQYAIYTPIADEVKAILEGKDPLDSLHDLLKQ